MIKRLKYEKISLIVTSDDFLRLNITTRNKWQEEVVVMHEIPIQVHGGWVMKTALPALIEDLFRGALKEVSDLSG